jgi:hypothetical protein
MHSDCLRGVKAPPPPSSSPSLISIHRNTIAICPLSVTPHALLFLQLPFHHSHPLLSLLSHYTLQSPHHCFPPTLPHPILPLPQALTGEGIIEYCIFVDQKQLTVIPRSDGCCSCLCKCFCSMLGGYDNNRLKRMRNDIFPQLDGPVHVADINSKEGDTFEVLNYVDRLKAGQAPERRLIKIAGGVFQRGVLYKKLPKEQVYVPSADWAEEQERSEILEIVTLLQAMGALAVEWEHVKCENQPGMPDLPSDLDDDATIQQRLKDLMTKAVKCFKIAAAAAASSAAKSLSDQPHISPLSGKIVFRTNERPPTTIDDLLASLGPEVYHIRSQPAVMRYLNMRMSRGIMSSTYFTTKHLATDSTWMRGMEELQVRGGPTNDLR